MKVTMYELLGMVKDDKAPKRIIYDKSKYFYNGLERDYYKYTTKDFKDEDIEYLFDYKITEILNDEVEIIEEEKKIPEKLPKSVTDNGGSSKDVRLIANTLNQVIDYLKSKGDE
jgi:hypothetical protein